jgi:type III pantothenate kinase
MLLVIDVGNTESVLGIFLDDTLVAHWRLSSTLNRTADECALLLKLWAQERNVSLSQIHGAVLSSVVPALTAVFSETVNQACGLEPIVVDSKTDTGIKINIESPRTLGADRICNAVAGFARHGGPLVIVDFGTATTFDVVSERGEYLGGAIALGIKSGAMELHRIAAKLPKVDLVFPESVIGKDTETSMQSGILWGTVSMVDGMISRIIADNGWTNVRVVATGGLAGIIHGKSQRIQFLEPFLTLEGMRLIYQRIASTSKQGGQA